MRNSYVPTISLLAAIASAQTFTDCNPLEKTCPANPALGTSAEYDNFSAKPDGFKEQSDNFAYNNGEAEFVIRESGNAPTLISEKYIFFGRVSVVMKAASGTGIVSSVVLQSDDLDEIDWEWIGGDRAQVQTNYFGKGDTSSYDRVTYVPISAPQDNYHNYTIDWSSDKIDWIIDNNVVRTLRYAEANGGNNYPQTPMTVRLGNWAGGDSDQQGTVEWAGGKTDFAQGPFTMNVRSISVQDASTGSAYEYSDNTGSFESIRVLDGEAGDQAAASASEAAATETSAASGIQAIGLPADRTTTPESATTISSVVSNSSGTAPASGGPAAPTGNGTSGSGAGGDGSGSGPQPTAPAESGTLSANMATSQRAGGALFALAVFGAALFSL